MPSAETNPLHQLIAAWLIAQNPTLKSTTKMSASIRSIADLEESLDQVSELSIRTELTAAEQAVGVDSIKAKYKHILDSDKKEIASLKKKIITWLKKESKRLFDGNETGTYQTNRTSLKWSNNPRALGKIDKDESDDALIERALQAGHDHVVKTVHMIDKEALEKLSDDDLFSIGWIRKKSKQLTVTPLAKTDAKERLKSPQPNT